MRQLMRTAGGCVLCMLVSAATLCAAIALPASARASVPRHPVAALIRAADVSGDHAITRRDTARWAFARRLASEADRHPRDGRVTRRELGLLVRRYAGADGKLSLGEWRRLLHALKVTALPKPDASGGPGVTTSPPAVVPAPSSPPANGPPTQPPPAQTSPLPAPVDCASLGGRSVSEESKLMLVAFDQDGDGAITRRDGWYATRLMDLYSMGGDLAHVTTGVGYYGDVLNRDGCMTPAEQANFRGVVAAHQPPVPLPDFLGSSISDAAWEIAGGIYDVSNDGAVTPEDGVEARAVLALAGATTLDHDSAETFVSRYDTAPSDGTLTGTEASSLRADLQSTIALPGSSY
jgi:hypothetical protein